METYYVEWSRQHNGGYCCSQECLYVITDSCIEDFYILNYPKDPAVDTWDIQILQEN